ncbi:MAG: hypothetical protein Q9220_005096 [cf. Caloplaca sp. 1 TL-2023]
MAEAQVDASAINDESPAQKQARLRRERREAKIKGAGSSRLDKITQLSGRPAEAVSSSSPTTQSPPLPSSADPDEVDISSHEYPRRSAQNPSRDGLPSEADIRNLLRSAPPSQDPRNGSAQHQAGAQEDPMAQMLQQLMGSMPGAPDGGPGALPPGLAALMGAEGSGSAASQGQNGGGESTSSQLWKVIHAVFALVLGVYITVLTTFNGSQILKKGTASGGDSQEGIGQRLFWIFATAEVVLQSTRYFLELGSTSHSGWLGMATQLLPEPWKSYVGLMARYSGIWMTAVQDAMVVVFILGAVAWWKGAVN